MAKKSSLLPIMGLLGVVVTFLYFFNTATIPGISASIGPYFTALVPGLLITLLGMVTAAEVKSGPGLVGCFTVVGVGLAIVLGAAYGVGMVTAGMLGAATLEQAQAVVVVASLLVGGGVYASRN